MELYYLPFLFMEEENESVCCSEQTKQVPIKEFAQKVWEFISNLTDENISDVTVFQNRVTVTYTILHTILLSFVLYDGGHIIHLDVH